MDRPQTKTWAQRSRSARSSRSTSAYQSCQPVSCMSSQRVPCPGSSGQRDGQPALGQVLGPGAQRLGRAGEAVTEQDADLSALVAERLGSGEDRHHGLLFVG